MASNDDWNGLFQKYGKQYNVDPSFGKSIFLNEGEPDGQGGWKTSSQGALGPVQIMPQTAKAYGVTDPQNHDQSAKFVMQYLSEGLDDAAKHGATNPIAHAAAYYHGGPDQNQWGPKTSNYVRKVTDTYRAQAGKPPIKQPETDPITGQSYDNLEKAAMGSGATPSAPATSAPNVSPITGHDYSDLEQQAMSNSAPEPTVAPKAAGKISGVIPNAAAGAVEGGSSVLNMLSDPFGNLIGKPLLAAGLAAHHALAPYTGWKDLTPEQRSSLLADDVPQPGDRLTAGIGRAIGAPATSDVVAVTPDQQMARSAASGAVGMGAFGMPVLGAVSGVAGQAASDAAPEPYKPLAGMVGNALTAGAYGAARSGVNKLTASTDPTVIHAVQDLGIPLRAGQTSGNALVRALDSEVGKMPWGGQSGSNEAQSAAVQRNIAASMGENATRIDPALMSQAKSRIGGVMNDIASRTTIKADPQFANDIKTIANTASNFPPEFAAVKKQIGNILDTVQANGGTIPGENYQTLIAKGSPLSIASKSTNSTEKHFAIQIREALDDAFQRSASPEDFAALKEARSQYKAMKTIEPLVNAGIPGQISPLRLQTVANRSYSNGAFTGRGDLGDIADIAQQYLKQPPDSGTPSRTLINNTFYGDAKGYGLKAAGAVAGRLAGTITNRPAVAPPGGFNLPAAIALAMQNRLNPGQ